MAIPGVRPRFLAPGDKLGKFELIRQIAVGGMAELYLARTMGIEGFEKLVVVKRILPQYADNQQFVTMFLNEARLSATLHHPNIAQVYDIGVEEGDYFFSMEYIHGEDLGRLSSTAIENGVPMSLDAALTLAAGLCAGLHYAHTKAGADGKPLEVVHRDVSPSNVLVSYDGGVKLVDFGIARAGSAPATTRGGLKGKIAYMSPEQCKGEAKLDRRSDIFSIGTILYELTTGRLPFLDGNEYAVLNNIVNTDVPKPSTIVPSYAPALEAIVLKALARDPAKRYATALELQKEIEDFAHENRLRVSPLVLARVMSTLFPARLEEWDQARAQGAFFVEQHVVRTLVESGKTHVEARLAQIPALDPPILPATAEPPKAVGPATDDEATDIVTALPPPKRTVREAGPFAPDDNTETIPGENPFGPDAGTLPGQGPLQPMPAIGRTPTPTPRAPTPPAIGRTSTPILRAPIPPTAVGPTPPMRATPVPGSQAPTLVAAPRAPTPTPPAPIPRPPTPTPVAPHIVAAAIAPEPQSFNAPVAGVLVSNPAVDIAAPIASAAEADVTERVRAPRNDDTAFVRTDRKSRAPIFLGVGLVLAGAAIAAFIAFAGSDATTPSASAKTSDRPAPAKVDPVIDPTAKPAPEPSEATAEPIEVEPTEPTEPTEPVEAKVEPSEPDPTAATEPAIEPTVEMKVEPVEPTPKPKPAKVVEAKRPVAKATKKTTPKKTTKKPVERPVVKKTEPKPEPKKETEWNADSPFMPVRQ